ncbi:efflux RND transporter periplasmic adaptor subunit [Bacteroidota bacterium]
MNIKVLLGPGMSLFILLTACKTGQKEESTIPPVGVRIQVVSNSDYVAPVRCTGKLSTKTESKLSFKTGGIIHRIMADEGQSVKKGQLLAELNLEEIRSKVRQAELVLKKAERDHQRAENLYVDSVVTLEQFENARTALDVARANDRIARFNMKYSAIHAPADGKILKRIAETNEIIAPGHPVFLFASTQNDWVVRANLTDRDVIRVQMLDSARILFDAYKDEVFMGLISEIGTASDPYTGTYEVEIQLLRKPEKLISGFIARINIFPGDKKERIIIPYESLLNGAGLTGYVYVVEDGSPIRRKIQIGSFADQGIIVESGLVEGEKVVVEGTQYLREGSPIEIIETVHQ